MKNKLFLFAICVIASAQLFGQQFDSESIRLSANNSFNTPLKSGFYHTLVAQNGYPSLQWPYPYRYLMNMRINKNDNAEVYQFQLSTSYVDDDRVFFRKVYPYGSKFNAKWQEFATRGENRFVGNQYVNGILFANEIKVEPTVWADFVFSPDYKLQPLSEVKTHIEKYRHLPDVPSEAQVKKEGVELSEMTVKLLQKIEELTLYVIQQDEKIGELNNKLTTLENLNK